MSDDPKDSQADDSEAVDMVADETPVLELPLELRKAMREQFEGLCGSGVLDQIYGPDTGKDAAAGKPREDYDDSGGLSEDSPEGQKPEFD